MKVQKFQITIYRLPGVCTIKDNALASEVGKQVLDLLLAVNSLTGRANAQ